MALTQVEAGVHHRVWLVYRVQMPENNQAAPWKVEWRGSALYSSKFGKLRSKDAVLISLTSSVLRAVPGGGFQRDNFRITYNQEYSPR